MSANPRADAHSNPEAKTGSGAGFSDRAFLAYNDRDGGQGRFYFPAGSDSATVGRKRSSDLVLDWDPEVSRLHARFERVGDDWEVVDGGLSRNGTFVNGERLASRRRLRDGDVMQFGSTTVTYCARAPSQPAAVRAAPSQPPPVSAVRPRPAVSLSTTQRRVLMALCRPMRDRIGSAAPATPQDIAEELVISASAVATHLSVLYAKLGVRDGPDSERRAQLAERALTDGLVFQRDP